MNEEKNVPETSEQEAKERAERVADELLANYRRQRVLYSQSMFHTGTRQTNFGKGGEGYTKTKKSETKKARKLAKKMRATNRRLNCHFR